jgi:hypothetical protein
VQPSSRIERWSFRRVFDPCTLCGTDRHAPRERAFDSQVDLFNGAGNPNIVPTIELPNGSEDDPTQPIFRASICEAVDRITVYLKSSTGRGKLDVPNPMQLELRTGLECIEEPQLRVIVTPKAWDDGGHLFTWATPVMFQSIVLTGTTLAKSKTDLIQGLSLRVFLDRAGMCCTRMPVLGPITTPP